MAELVKQYPEKIALQARYKTLIYALSSANPKLRLSLIHGDIKPEEFVKMSEREL